MRFKEFLLKENNESYISEAIIQEAYRMTNAYLLALKNNTFGFPQVSTQS